MWLAAIPCLYRSCQKGLVGKNSLVCLLFKGISCNSTILLLYLAQKEPTDLPVCLLYSSSAHWPINRQNPRGKYGYLTYLSASHTTHGWAWMAARTLWLQQKKAKQYVKAESGKATKWLILFCSQEMNILLSDMKLPEKNSIMLPLRCPPTMYKIISLLAVNPKDSCP